MKSNLRSIFLGAALVAAGFVTFARGEMVGIHPSLDNSIYSDFASNSNALGNLFAGRNNSGGLRRALLQFDVAGSIPAGSIINSVSLGIFQAKHASNSTLETFELHPVSAAWGEGTSTGAGSGVAATTGDATWTHRLFSSDLWITSGGDFGATSGTASIGTTDNLFYTFGSQPALVADVQSWLNMPASNFGWLLKAANDSTIGNSREFVSGEGSLSQQPTLTIDYTAVPEPGSTLLLGVAAIAASRCRQSRRRSRVRQFGL